MGVCISKKPPKPRDPDSRTRERFNSSDSILKPSFKSASLPASENDSHPMGSYVFPRSNTLKVPHD
jgi:hypothetical protein